MGLFLTNSGRSVNIVTPYSSLGSDPHTSHGVSEVHLTELLKQPDVSVRTNTYIQRIEEGKVFLANYYTDGQLIEEETDSLILLNHFEGDQSLRSALTTSELELHVVGDALGFGPMHDAVLAGHRVGRLV